MLYYVVYVVCGLWFDEPLCLAARETTTDLYVNPGTPETDGALVPESTRLVEKRF